MTDINIRQLLQDADAHVNGANYKESTNLYRNVVAIYNNCTAAWYGLGVIYAKLENLVESIYSFEQAHRINPDYGPTNANLALLLEQKDPERAANFAKMAIESIGDNPELLRISILNSAKDIKLFEKNHVYQEPKENMDEISSNLRDDGDEKLQEEKNIIENNHFEIEVDNLSLIHI